MQDQANYRSNQTWLAKNAWCHHPTAYEVYQESAAAADVKKRHRSDPGANVPSRTKAKFADTELDTAYTTIRLWLRAAPNSWRNTSAFQFELVGSFGALYLPNPLLPLVAIHKYYGAFVAGKRQELIAEI